MGTACNGCTDDGGVMACTLLGPGHCSALQLLLGKVEQGAPGHFPWVPCERHTCLSSYGCSAPPEGAELPESLWPELLCMCSACVCVQCLCVCSACMYWRGACVCAWCLCVCVQCSSCATSAVKGASVALSAECCPSLHHMQGCAVGPCKQHGAVPAQDETGCRWESWLGCSRTRVGGTK